MYSKKQKWIKDEYCKNEIIHHRIKKTILNEKTFFQEIQIVDLFDYGRSLFIDGIPQSSAKDEFIYHESLIHPAIILVSKRKDLKVLILGTGEGATIRELLKYKFIKKIDAVDIDKKAIQIYRKYLKGVHHNSYDNKKVRLVFEGAIEFLKNSKEKYDIIISDITDVDFFDLGEKEIYKQEDFYKLIRARLKNSGILAMHSSELTFIHNKKHKDLKKSVKKVMTNVYSYSVYVPFFECQWGFLLATKNNKIRPDIMTEDDFSKKIDKSINLRFIDKKVLRSIFNTNLW